jgi:hypothetical protein
MRIWIRPWRFWKPLKRTSIEELRQRIQIPKVRREVLNLVSSINYDDSSASSRLRKGKAHAV